MSGASDSNPRCAWAKKIGDDRACARRSGQWCVPCQVFFGGASPTSKPLTSETITDAQIEELCAGNPDQALHRLVCKALGVWWPGLVAEMKIRHAVTIANCRARCAEIINARREAL